MMLILIISFMSGIVLYFKMNIEFEYFLFVHKKKEFQKYIKQYNKEVDIKIKKWEKE